MLDTTFLLFVSLPLKRSHRNKGAIAQLGERLRGTQSVSPYYLNCLLIKPSFLAYLSNFNY